MKGASPLEELPFLLALAHCGRRGKGALSYGNEREREEEIERREREKEKKKEERRKMKETEIKNKKLS